VVESRADADLELRVERRIDGIAGGPPITIVTFGILPSVTWWVMKVKLTRLGPDRMPDSCLRIQGYTQWTQLFLLPFMSGHSAAPYERAVVSRLTGQCLAEVFREPPGPARAADQG
jgi:hypothetical protein